MNIKKLMLCLYLMCISMLAQSQGLEGLIVEKYYVSDANDAAGSVGTLPTGSVTWRFYVDMLPGYKLQAVYGVDAAPATAPGVLSPGDHELRLETTTSFFNNEDRGAITPTYTKLQTRNNTVMLDSWVSVGGACQGHLGIEKSSDDGVNTTVNIDGLLQNADPSAGIPLNGAGSQDGLIAGTVQPVTFVGFTTELDILDATSQAGSLISTYNASWASLLGSTGPNADNVVLIAQLTTDGFLTYAFNIQIISPAGVVERYVYSNPVGDEILETSLRGIVPNPCDVLVCDDNNACTDDNCDPFSGCVYTPFLCDDGDPCTDDACDVVSGCFAVPTVCDDANVCNGLETCDPLVGCLPGTSLDCDDNNACTIDGCDALTGCTYAAVDCNDNNVCTLDACDALTGCTYVAVDCNDNNACTSDGCDPLTGCTYSPVVCNDGSACTMDDCDPLIGCTFTPVNCDDGNSCTTDGCDPLTGCTYVATGCDDGNACTIDACDPLGGCNYAAVDCNDNNVCTTDGCDALTGCTYAAVDCNDGDLCTDDYCSPASGCNYFPHPCDDGSGCTIDGCNPLTGCFYTDSLCNDNDACTMERCEDPIGCNVYATVNCDDGDTCTIDGCDPLAGCVYSPNVNCDPCLVLNCDDGNPCTIDACDPITLCSNTPINNSVTISQTTASAYCQSSVITLTASSAEVATGYSWSTGATTQSISASAAGVYSVTVEFAPGCFGTASVNLTAANFTTLLSSYVIIAKDKVALEKNIVFSGGVGVNKSNGKIELKGGSLVVAAGTFSKAYQIMLSGGSLSTVKYFTPANVMLPVFEYNTTCSGPNVKVKRNTSVTLSGTNYGDVELEDGATVTFTKQTVKIKKLKSADNCRIKFADCSRIRICKNVELGKRNIVNSELRDVILFVEEDVIVKESSKVSVDIYTLRKLIVEMGKPSNHNVMKGLFIAKEVDAKQHTDWIQNTNCSVCAMKAEEEVAEEIQPLLPSDESNVSLNAYPNPFADKLTIDFSVGEDSRVTLEVFNLSGQRLAVLFDGNVQAAEMKKVEFTPENLAGGMIIYRLQTEKGAFFGKAVMAR